MIIIYYKKYQRILEKECEGKSKCCIQCFKKKHDSHKKQCKSFTQINAIILQETSMIREIQQILQNDFEKLSINYQKQMNFLEKEKCKMIELENSLKNQNFKLFDSLLGSFKQWYFISQNDSQYKSKGLDELLQYLNKISETQEQISKSFKEKEQTDPKSEVQSAQQQENFKPENKISEWQQEFDELMKINQHFLLGKMTIYLGMYFRRSGFVLESLKHFEQALIENPQKIVSYFYKGKTLQELNRLDDAMKCFDEAISIALKPNQAPLINEKGSQLYKKRMHFTIIKQNRRSYIILQLSNQSCVNGYTNKGYLNLKLGFALNLLNRFEEAIKCFEQAIVVNPKCSLAYNNKGLSLFNLNKLNEALICFDLAISIDPQYTKALNSKGNYQFITLGIILDQQRKYKEAFKCYDRVTQIDSNNFEAYHNQGLTLANMERFVQAIVQFQKAISIQPKYFHAYINLAYALTRLNRLDEALSCYNKAIEINPNNPISYDKMGLTLYLLGRQREAEKYFAEAKIKRGK